MSEKHNFTVPEFNGQVLEFRKLFGDTKFWEKDAATRRIATDALGMAYLFLEPGTPKAEVNRCADILSQTLAEYQDRELRLIIMGKVEEPS